MKLLARIGAPFAWKVVRQHDGYTYFEIQSRVGAAATGLAASGATSISSSCAPAMSLTDRSASGLLGFTSAQLCNVAKGRHRPEAGGSWNPVKIACAKRRNAIGLPNSQIPRVLALVGRCGVSMAKLAERAAERQKRSWPLMPDAVRMN